LQEARVLLEEVTLLGVDGCRSDLLALQEFSQVYQPARSGRSGYGGALEQRGTWDEGVYEIRAAVEQGLD